MRRVHEVTIGWAQRPGFSSASELLTEESGGDVRLNEMPSELARIVRSAWMPILGGDQCAIHGALGGGNVLVDGNAVALVDWDEARVDVPWFDFAHLPREIDVPAPCDRDVLITAGVAWEARHLLGTGARICPPPHGRASAATRTPTRLADTRVIPDLRAHAFWTVGP